MGLFKFGFVTIYLSEPLTRALTFGASIHVFSSQIKHVFGIKVGQFSGPLKLVYVSPHHFYRTTRMDTADYTRYFRPSVRLSHGGILSKWLHISGKLISPSGSPTVFPHQMGW